MDDHEAARFLFEEADLLDRADYAAWLALFTEDAIYWVPSHPGQTDPVLEVSLFHEDRALMQARVGRLSHARALGLPTRASRLLGNVRAARDDGEIVIRSRFQMIEFVDDEQRLYGGAATHRLAMTEAGWRIRLKRIDLVNAGGVFDLLQGFF